MAIIKCPECGQSVSEHAANCPGCGCPINGNIDYCPDCGAIVLKTYTECPNCHCPIQQIEQRKANENHLLVMATDSFNKGKYNEASGFVDEALKADAQNPELLALKSQISTKLQGMEQKYNEAKHLFADEHQPYPALALVNKLIAIEPYDKYTDLKDQIVSSITKEQIDKAHTLINAHKYEAAEMTLSKALSLDPENAEIRALRDEVSQKEEQQRKKKRNITITIVVVVILAIVCTAGVILYNIQAENTAWDKLQSSTNLNDYEQFLAEYPHGRHHDEAQVLFKKLSAELTDWATVANSVDKYAVKTFLEKYPNGVCVNQAKDKLDSLSWVDACNINKPEAYAQYIADFPNGRFLSLAQQKTTQLKAMEVTPEETSQITALITQFFDAVANQDETNLLASVESTLSSFLNVRNATKVHVLKFMKQMHEADMTSMQFTVNRDLKIKKNQQSDGQYSYIVTCSVDEKIERTDTTKDTFVSYGVLYAVDNFMKISSFGLKKMSSN